MIGASSIVGKDEAAIWDIINEEWADMNYSQKQLWELIKIAPEKWVAAPYEFRPAEAWVVAIIGAHVIWYNECWFGEQFDGMDSGFSCATYAVHGQIGDGYPATSTLGDVVQSLLMRVRPT